MSNNGMSKVSLLLAWLIALAALIATLYSSQILKMPVCVLCWYQRIALYPLTIILGIALYRDDCQIGVYTIPLAFLGAIFALYQYLMQMIPSFAPIQLCGSSGPVCSDVHFRLFGFVTYPFLSLVACLMIAGLLSSAFLFRD